MQRPWCEEGNVVKHKFVEVSTFKINDKTNKLEEFQRMSREVGLDE